MSGQVYGVKLVGLTIRLILRNRIENHLCDAKGLMFKTPTTSQLWSHGFVWVISLRGRVLVQQRAR